MEMPERVQHTFIRDESEILGNKRSVGRSRKIVKAPVIYDCSSCGLDKSCKSPKIKRFGHGEKEILVIGLCQGKSEDVQGIPLVGASGVFAKEKFNIVGIDLDKDCTRTNLVACYPGKDNKGKDKPPTDHQIKCCESNLIRDIEETKPKLIICLGTEASQAILRTDGVGGINVTRIHGKVFPYHRLNCWVGSLYHPSYFLHRKSDNIKNKGGGSTSNEDRLDDGLIFAYDLAAIVPFVDIPLPQPLSRDGNKFVTDIDEAVLILKNFSNTDKIVAFDYETTCLSPFEEGARIICVSITDSSKYGYCIPITLKDKFFDRSIFTGFSQHRIIEALKGFITSSTPKTVQNFYTEELWSRRILGVSINNFVHDTMVSYHVINGRTGINGLDFQVFELRGHEYKGSVNPESIENSSIDDLSNYSSWDSRYGIMACNSQLFQLKSDSKLFEFNDLFTRSLLTFANLRDRGIKIDRKALDELKSKFSKKLNECEESLRSSKEVKDYEQEFHTVFNPNAPPQCEKLLYGKMKVQVKVPTPTGKGSTNDETLKMIYKSTNDSRVKNFLDHLFKYRKYADVIKKIAEYEKLIYSDGRIHSSFNLHTAISFRSSAQGPNSQNMYEHDAELREFRRCIIPEDGQVLLEGDYKGIEVAQIAMTSGDPELIRQVTSNIDFHKKYAGRIIGKSIEEVTDDEKYGGKNGFVFPTFYGSLPPAIAKYFDMKYSIDHLQKIQNEFWTEFAGVKQWQKDTIKFYEEHGYIEGLSGFKVPGPLTIYQIYNMPIQGTAFHLFLDALNRIDKYLIDHNFKSKIINEIHDSLVISADPDEVEDVMKICTEIMTSKRFSWQTVPLRVSWEMGENWFEMSKI